MNSCHATSVECHEESAQFFCWVGSALICFTSFSVSFISLNSLKYIHYTTPKRKIWDFLAHTSCYDDEESRNFTSSRVPKCCKLLVVLFEGWVFYQKPELTQIESHSFHHLDSLLRVNLISNRNEYVKSFLLFFAVAVVWLTVVLHVFTSGVCSFFSFESTTYIYFSSFLSPVLLICFHYM